VSIPTASQLLEAVEPPPAPPSTDKPLKIGTIDPAFTSGLPKVTFDGETTMSSKTYAYIGSRPAAGSRVVLAPVGTGYVILGAIGTESASNNGYFNNLTVAGSASIAGAESVGAAITVTRSSGAAYNAQQTGDTVARFLASTDGSLRFGPGNAAVDVILSRTAANELALASGDNLKLGTSSVLTSSRVTNLTAAATAALTLTTTITDVPGAFATFSTTNPNAWAIVHTAWDFSVASTGTSTMTGDLSVDGVLAGPQGILSMASTTRATVHQVYVASLASAGSHTLRLRAQRGASGTGNCNSTHTRMVILLFDYP
jgi:hypothetical protein